MVIYTLHTQGPRFVESHICQNRADMGHPSFVTQQAVRNADQTPSQSKGLNAPGLIALLRGLSKLVRQHGKKETVDEPAVCKYGRTQDTFLNKAKPAIKADRRLVGDIDLEKDPV